MGLEVGVALLEKQQERTQLQDQLDELHGCLAMLREQELDQVAAGGFEMSEVTPQEKSQVVQRLSSPMVKVVNLINLVECNVTDTPDTRSGMNIATSDAEASSAKIKDLAGSIAELTDVAKGGTLQRSPLAASRCPKSHRGRRRRSYSSSPAQ